MVERRRRSGRVLGALRGASLATMVAGLAASLLLAVPPGVFGADHVEGSPLDGPFADAALVPASSPGAGEAIPPRLLVLRSPAIDANGIVRVGLLERGRSGWEVVGEQALPSGLAGPVEGGFLLSLDDDRFAIAASSGRGIDSSSVLLGITLYRRQISTWARTGLPMSIDAAGAADADGNGSPEVVALERGEGLCGGALVSVVSGSDLGEVRRLSIEGYRTSAGTFGRFDARPGADLALGSRRTCGDGAATVDGAIIVSLRDGSTTEVEAVDEPPASAQRPLPARPLAADLDGDARDDLVTAGRDGVVAHAAADGWRPRAVGRQGLPLGALPVEAGSGTWVAVLDGSEPRRVVRVHGLSVAGERTLATDAPEPGETLRSAANFTLDAIAGSTAIRFAAGSWSGDVDGDGCPDLLVARLTLLCADGGSVRIGPGWYATSPIGAYGESGARRLVVAGTAAWPSASAVLSAPTPAGDAAAPTGWRSSVSAPFLLSEVSVGDLLYHREFPVPGVAMGRAQPTGEELAVSLGGFTGERMFVRSVALTVSDIGSNEPLAGFLAGAGGPRGSRSVERIPVAPGADSGAANGFIRLPLALDVAAHQVTAVGINDWGEVSPIERVRVEADRIGPTLVVAAPLTSLPWPFLARLDGVADPGSRVRLGGEEVEVPRNGRFSLRTSLAPWPQTLEFTAIDGAGNETVRRVSVVGGVDYRQFPWEVILGALVLAAALGASLRAPRRAAGPGAAGPRLARAGPLLVLGGVAVPAAGSARSLRADGSALSQAVDADGLPIAVIEDLD